MNRLPLVLLLGVQYLVLVSALLLSAGPAQGNGAISALLFIVALVVLGFSILAEIAVLVVPALRPRSPKVLRYGSALTVGAALLILLA